MPVQAVCPCCVAWSNPTPAHAILAETDRFEVSRVDARSVLACRVSSARFVSRVAGVVENHAVGNWCDKEFVEGSVRQHGGSFPVRIVVCEQVSVSSACLAAGPFPALIH